MDIRRLNRDDVGLLRELNQLFGEVFEEPKIYHERTPSDSYLEKLLGNPAFIAYVATLDGYIVGGVTAYTLPKYEQERSEIYIYDLAVMAEFRRRGIATALIKEVRRLASQTNAWVVMIQAELEDADPVSLYSKLGRKETVHHFDLEPLED